jgi:S1-C subfamily serine protease
MTRNTRARAVAGAAVCLLLASGASAQQSRGNAGRFQGAFTVQDGARLGVAVRDVEPSDANAQAGGAVITAVTPNSPAASAGLAVGDVVVEFDGERVRSARQFARLVQESVQGRQVRATVLRSGKRQDLTITPEASPASALTLDRGRIDDLVRQFENVRPQLFLPGAPRLGVSVVNMTPELARHFGAAEGGVLVSSVTAGSAAAQAGLQVGDVITSAAGQRVRSQADLTQSLRKATGSLTLDIIRDRKPMAITVSMAASAKVRLGGGRVI